MYCKYSFIEYLQYFLSAGRRIVTLSPTLNLYLFTILRLSVARLIKMSYICE